MLDFCTEFHIPVVTPIWDRGTVDQPSPNFLGIIGATTGGPAILSDADCILLAGAENDYRIGYLKPPSVRLDAGIFRIGADWKALGRVWREPHEAGRGAGSLAAHLCRTAQ